MTKSIESFPMASRLPKLFRVAALILVLAGCASDMMHREGLGLLEQGQMEAGLAALEKAVEESPRNAVFRKDLYVHKAAYIEQLLARGDAERKAGKFATAEENFNKVLLLEPHNVRARASLDALVRDRRHDETVSQARVALKSGDVDQAQRLLRPVLLENADFPPASALRQEITESQAKRKMSEQTLRSNQEKPINIDFRDASVRIVFEALSRSSGINFILDKDVRPDLNTSISVKGTSVENAIDLVLQTCQLQKKVLNPNTVLIYPNTPEKLKEYQDLMVRTFYLQNADVKQVENTLKTLLKAKDLVADEKLNLIIMRDTPEAIQLAEKLVATQDMAEPEVMLEVEIMEVLRSRLVDLGVQWPTQLSLTPLASGGGTLTLNDLRNLNRSRIGAAVGQAGVDARQELADTNLLANPRIRVRNREKAKVMVGDRIPIVTTTSTSTGFVADSIQYIDVGLKVELEPNIYLQGDVAIKVELEVSSLGSQVRAASGTVAHQIGTRTASTILRLRDGETQILAGLLSDEERASGAGLPGLSGLPLIGRLFGSRSDSKKKTEIVMSITPRMVRNLQLPDAGQGEFWSGSENTLRTRPLSLQEASPAAPGAGSDGATNVGASVLSNVQGGSSPAAENVTATWEGPAEVKQGEEFKLQLKVKSDGALRVLPLQAAFDPSVLQVVAISEGDFFKQDDGSSSFSSNVDATAGKFFISVSRTAVMGAQGEGVAAEVTLRALSPAEKTDVRLLTIEPISDGGKAPAALLPPAFSIAVSP
ncbi:MAG: cohesin domain-containing protein [Betaproteobacteria bacterium]|nr:cohesin domain-containing protein [Betaproteobacteria bacterium]